MDFRRRGDGTAEWTEGSFGATPCVPFSFSPIAGVQVEELVSARV